MKRISTLIATLGLVAFGATAATAADLRAAPAYRAGPAAVAPYYNWSGFYIGAHIGGAWADKDWVDVGPPAFNLGGHSADGILGGGQIGFNWQTGAWVFGIEAQYSWADLDGDHVNTLVALRLRTDVESVGTVAARIGYAWANWMLYAKGGWAWAHDKYAAFDTGTGLLFASASDTRSGWMLGLGLEYGFTPNWSMKIEYNYMDFGSDRIDASSGPAGPGGIVPVDIDQRISLVKVGINYRFGGKAPAPVVTKY